MTAYTEAKAQRDAIQSDLDRHSATLGGFAKGPLGLTPSAVKAMPEYQAAKAAYDQIFECLRAFNASFTRNFAREIRDERQARLRSLSQAPVVPAPRRGPRP